jgi:hypothetical protein
MLADVGDVVGEAGTDERAEVAKLDPNRAGDGTPAGPGAERPAARIWTFLNQAAVRLAPRYRGRGENDA